MNPTFSHKSLPSNLDVTLDKISFGFMFPLRWETKKYFVVKSRNHQLRPIISHIKYHISPISSNHHQFISPLPPDIGRNFLNIICVVIDVFVTISNFINCWSEFSYILVKKLQGLTLRFCWKVYQETFFPHWHCQLHSFHSLYRYGGGERDKHLFISGLSVA